MAKLNKKTLYAFFVLFVEISLIIIAVFTAITGNIDRGLTYLIMAYLVEINNKISK